MENNSTDKKELARKYGYLRGRVKDFILYNKGTMTKSEYCRLCRTNEDKFDIAFKLFSEEYYRFKETKKYTYEKHESDKEGDIKYKVEYEFLTPEDILKQDTVKPKDISELKATLE